MYKLVHNTGLWGAVDRERDTRVPREIGNVAALLVSGLLLLGQDNTSRDIPAARMHGAARQPTRGGVCMCA